MSLGDDEALLEWASQKPHPAVARVVRDWVVACSVTPWLAPSIPIPELADQPDYEIRQAIVPDSGGVLVVYRHTYATSTVDLIYVGDDVELCWRRPCGQREEADNGDREALVGRRH